MNKKLIAATTAALLVLSSVTASYAAVKKVSGTNLSKIQLRDQDRLHDGSCQLAKDQTRDQLRDPIQDRLHDGSCKVAYDQTRDQLKDKDQLRDPIQDRLHDGSCKLV